MDPLDEHRAALKTALLAEAIRSFGEIRLRVIGISMLPTLWPGDILLVRRCAADELQPGQIVQYIRDGLPIAHRMVGSRGGHWLARGDCNRYTDPPISGNQMLGRVVSIERNGRFIDPALNRARRLAGWFLRRSEVLARVVLRVRMAAQQ
jgi:signal peptidase I